MEAVRLWRVSWDTCVLVFVGGMQSVTPLPELDALYVALQLLHTGEGFKHQAEASCRWAVCGLTAGAGRVHLYCQTTLTLQSGLQTRASVFWGRRS